MEIWRVIPSAPKYEASSWGRIRNAETLHLRSFVTGADGYHRLTLVTPDGVKCKYVHRLVAEAFIPADPDRLTVNHRDHNRLNNNLDNLEWMTSTEQNRHKRHSGTRDCGKPLYRISYDNEREWFPTIGAAADSVGGKRRRDRIGEAAAGKIPHAYGYKWKLDIGVNLDGEVWQELPKSIATGSPMWVSSMGRVRNHQGCVRSGYINSAGYLYVSIDGQGHRLHRLVAQAFVPNPEGLPVVNHRDGDKTNARASNLEWVTRAQNCQHAHDTGLNSSCKPVVQYDKDGNWIANHRSIAAAARSTEGVKQTVRHPGSKPRLSKEFCWTFEKDL